MDALHTALRPITSLLNRQIRARAPARALSNELDGKTIAIRIRDTSLAAYLHIAGEELVLSGEFDREPDVILSGTLLALLQMSRSAGEDLIRKGEIELTGDAQLAGQFRKLMKFARPDPEEELSRVVGDVAAHGVGDIVRGIGKWGRRAGATLRQNVSEYLQEESRALPSRYEVERFRGSVEALRDDVARFEARLRRLEPLPTKQRTD